MDNNMLSSSIPSVEDLPKIKKQYTKYDTAAALLLFPVSYAFVRLSGAADYPLGRFITFAILFGLALIYFKKSGISLCENKFALGFGISLLILHAGLVFTSSGEISFAISAIGFLSFPYFVFTMTGNSSERYPNLLLFLEAIKALFIMPFGSISASFEAMSKAKGFQKIGKNLLMILCGLGIAIIPAIVVFALLSYDASFRELINKIFDLEDLDIFSFIGDMIFTVPTAILLFGAFYSGKNKRFSKILNKEQCQKTADSLRFAPAVLACSAVSPFIVIYSIFFISQLDYYLSAFGGVLPEGLTYANYAKSGFFELCSVSAINAVIIICVSVFGKKRELRSPIPLRIANFLLSLLTLVLIATAISKMVLYIGTYGLTVKRILSGSFMIFLAVVFTAVLISQFAKKTNVTLTALVTALIICVTLAFGDVNGIIADYNTDRYLDGTLEEIDCSMLFNLGDSGIIHLHRVAEESPDIITKNKAKNLLKSAAAGREEDNSFFSLTIPGMRADKILNNYSAKDD